MDRVVVGIDGRAPSSPALERAAQVARRRGVALEVVAVWTHPPMSTEERLLTTAGFLEDETRLLVDRQIIEVLGRRDPDDLRVDVRVERGPPAKSLLAAAEGAELLVVGRRDASRVHRLLLGSVADQCIRHAPCPTMVVPPGEGHARGKGDRIVVGVDGSADAERALAWALEEAKSSGTTVRAILCWREPLDGMEDLRPIAPDPAELEAAARRRLNTMLSDLVVPAGVHLERSVEQGDAAHVLVRESEEADLLVVGSRGLGGFGRLVLGSVAHHAAHLAACPVVILPHPR